MSPKMESETQTSELDNECIVYLPSMENHLQIEAEKNVIGVVDGDHRDEICCSDEELDPAQAEKSLIELITQDEHDKLVKSTSLFKLASNQEDSEDKDRSLAFRLLHLACYLDAVQCAEALIEGEIGPGLGVNDIDKAGRTALHSAAEMHAEQCIELLLNKKARTDIRSSDDNAELPIEAALSSQKMLIWNMDQTLEDLLVILSEMDLSAIKTLAEKTKGIAEVAYATAIEGGVVSLAALLMVVPEKVWDPIMVLRPDGGLASKETTTIYQCLMGEALYLGQKGGSSKVSRHIGLLSNKERRKSLLCEIELLQLFGAAVLQRSFTTNKRAKSPLIRASQAGDEEVVELLLNTNIDVNETDVEENSALHCYLKNSSNTKNTRILLLLIKHGAKVNQRNRLGLTPLHIAAANGYFEALQILLHIDLDCVDAVSEMKETPLFFAVKNDFRSCAQLLLRNGANIQIRNLRKQRPIDLAKSQEMRLLLTQNITWSRPIQLKEIISPLNGYQAESDRKTLGPFSDLKREIGATTKGANCLHAHGEAEPALGKLRHQEMNKEILVTGCPSTEGLEHKIFVGGIPSNVDSEALREFFEDQFGAVEEAVVMRSQEADQVCSRGFGFVTFKNKESAVAAVQVRYMNFWGRKVEIKGAVRNLNLFSKMPKVAPKAQQQSQGAHERMYLAGNLLHKQPSKHLNQPHWKSDPTPKDQSLPLWVTTLKKWLSGFLKDTYMHLTKGEWYPLSSLKSDFKNICGFELDHASISYSKLSDFMHSFPDICRMMKTVPINGRGSSHIVLLPNFLITPKHYEILEPVESPRYSKSPSLDKDDNNDDFRSIHNLEAASVYENFHGHVGSGNTLDPNPVPWKPTSGGWDPMLYGGGRGEDNSKLSLIPQHSKDEAFSYFSRQVFFFKEYRNCQEKKTCFRCEARKMMWIAHPCKHLLWCTPCMQLFNRQQSIAKCVICDTNVEKYVPSQNPADEKAFPTWDPNFARKPARKECYLQRRGFGRRDLGSIEREIAPLLPWNFLLF